MHSFSRFFFFFSGARELHHHISEDGFKLLFDFFFLSFHHKCIRPYLSDHGALNWITTGLISAKLQLRSLKPRKPAKPP